MSACGTKILEDFWTASTCGMDKSIGKSQVINSSVSRSTPTNDGHVTANPINPAEFGNHGLHLWNQIRQQWIGHKKHVNQPQQLHEPKLNWNATYDSLFGSNKPLPKPIPLAEMVDFLMDFWELEGLYD
ncbi:uncharacterized protein LOC132632991 isoform X2 [Lycium barbarum]|uniref:uncharacterized protein LOC132632991 isoform X2 n=1 Tax=Lycium barbarum TaxID=112863 RepID=UPI00293E2701|nr:uncharacterized protein LOC132632991 isoform X2 [Lycium barbarum]